MKLSNLFLLAALSSAFLIPFEARATGFVDFSPGGSPKSSPALAPAPVILPPNVSEALTLSSPTIPVPGSIISLSGILGVEKGKKGFSAGVIDLTAYTFTGVPIFKTLDLHLFGGLGVNTTVNGAVTAGGGLGRSFKLADQAYGFLDLGFAWLQGLSGPSPIIQGGIIIRF